MPVTSAGLSTCTAFQMCSATSWSAYLTRIQWLTGTESLRLCSTASEIAQASASMSTLRYLGTSHPRMATVERLDRTVASPAVWPPRHALDGDFVMSEQSTPEPSVPAVQSRKPPSEVVAPFVPREPQPDEDPANTMGAHQPILSASLPSRT